MAQPTQAVSCVHRWLLNTKAHTKAAMEEIAVLLAQAGDAPTPEECSRFVSAIAAQLENNKGNFATVLKALGAAVGQVSQAHATKKLYRTDLLLCDHLVLLHCLAVMTVMLLLLLLNRGYCFCPAPILSPG